MLDFVRYGVLRNETFAIDLLQKMFVLAPNVIPIAHLIDFVKISYSQRFNLSVEARWLDSSYTCVLQAGWTAIMYASFFGRAGVVKVLLGDDDVDLEHTSTANVRAL